jgi:hypothetical protein
MGYEDGLSGGSVWIAAKQSIAQHNSSKGMDRRGLARNDSGERQKARSMQCSSATYLT